jgi:CheY-like chemotaxis protein
MPTLDGKACLAAIKDDDRWNSVPVVMYTTSSNSIDEKQCRDLGAFDYLRKPNSIQEGQSELEMLFKRLNVLA